MPSVNQITWIERDANAILQSLCIRAQKLSSCFYDCLDLTLWSSFWIRFLLLIISVWLDVQGLILKPTYYNLPKRNVRNAIFYTLFWTHFFCWLKLIGNHINHKFQPLKECVRRCILMSELLTLVMCKKMSNLFYFLFASLDNHLCW